MSSVNGNQELRHPRLQPRGASTSAYTLDLANLRSFDCRRVEVDQKCFIQVRFPRAGNRNCVIKLRSAGGRQKLKLHAAKAGGVS